MEWNKTWVRLAATLSSIMALKWRPPKILRSRKDLDDILNFKYQNVLLAYRIGKVVYKALACTALQEK